MSVYLSNAIPNAWMPHEGHQITITGISLEEAQRLTTKFDHYADYDDNIAPAVLNCQSLVGHRSVADAFSRALWQGATLDGHPILVEVPVNRVMFTPVAHDLIVVGLVIPPRRLAEGETWTEQELSSMPISWLRVDVLQ